MARRWGPSGSLLCQQQWGRRKIRNDRAGGRDDVRTRSGWPGSGASSGAGLSPPWSHQRDSGTCWERVKASFEPCHDPVTLPTEPGLGEGRAL